MKKTWKISLLIVSCLSFSACFNNFSVPKRISVKTNAKYKFTVADMGKLTETFTDSLSIQKVIDSMGTGTDQNNFQIYSYNPDNRSPYQQLLLRMPISDIPVDVGSYFDSSNINSQFNSSNSKVSKSFDIPELAKKISQKFSLSEIDQKINKGIVFTGASSPLANLNVIFDDDRNGFTSLSYKEGGMLVRLQDDAAAGSTLNGSVVLVNADGNEVASGTFVNNVARLDLEDVTITSTGMKLRFSDSVGVLFIATIEDGSKINSAIGLSIAEETFQGVEGEIKEEITVEIADENSEFTGYTIGEGSLLSDIKLPASWKNVTVSYVADLSEAFTLSDIRSGEAKPLNDITIDPYKDLKANMALQFSFNNSTVVFTDEPTVEVDLSITKLKSATMKVSEDMVNSLKIDIDQKLPEEALKTLKAINWGKSSINLRCVSTLPEGNDIKLNGSSEFFGIDDNKTIKSGISDTQNLAFETSDSKEIKIGTGAEEYDAVDFSVGIELPSYDATAKTFTISNLETKKTYKLDIDFSTTFDWNSVTLDISTIASGINQTISTGIKPATLFGDDDSSQGGFKLTDIIKDLNFTQVPVYIFCSIPDASVFQNVGFHGTVKGFLGEKEVNALDEVSYNPISDLYYLLGDATGPKELALQSEPKMEFSKTKEKEIITNVGKNVVNKSDLVDLLNSAKNSQDGAELCVSYNMKITGSDGSSNITLNKEDLENGSADSISVSAIIVLPLQFEISNNGLNIDLMELLNKDEDPSGTDDTHGDILKRTEPWSSDPENGNEVLDKLLDVLDYVAITYSTPDKLPFNFSPDERHGADKETDLKLVIDLDGTGNIFEECIYPLSTGNSIKVEDPKELLEIYPLKPTLKIQAKNGYISIPREIGLSTKVGLEIVTNGEEIQILDFAADEGGN